MADRSSKLALFPASFDPVTNGHLDLIRRTRSVFDEVVVAVVENVDKRGGTFTTDERLEMLRQGAVGFVGALVVGVGGFFYGLWVVAVFVF